MALMKVSAYVSKALKSISFVKTGFCKVNLHYCTAAHPTIHVNKSDVLVDEKVHITISGLTNQQKVTVLSSFNSLDKTFVSCGHYVADGQGGVDLACHSSLGGSFSGIQPMGLFTSTKELNGEARLLKGDITTPYDVTLSVHDGHMECESLAENFVNSDTETLTMTSLKRWYMGPGVRWINIQEPEWMNGSLFLPPGKGPFPGIIEVHGSQRRLMRHCMAVLMASHGYAVLDLDHTFYRDENRITTDYFVDACDWFSQYPLVSPGGVSMVTHSSATSISLWMAMHSENVKTLVALNGVPFPMPGFSFNFNGTPVKEVKLDETTFTFTEKGMMMKDMFDDISPTEHLIPIWERDVKALFISGDDDMCFDPKWTRFLEEAIPCEKKEHFKFLYYQGAGHQLEPPYAPPCISHYHKTADGVVWYGGTPECNTKAQEHAWAETLAFLQKHQPSR